FAHVGGFAASQEVIARRREEIDHLGVLAEPCLVLRTSWNDHDVALAADPLFVAEAELHLALQHPHALFLWVTVWLDMDAGPDAPAHDHPLVAGENASSTKAANRLKPIIFGITSSQSGWSLASYGRRKEDRKPVRARFERPDHLNSLARSTEE